MDLNFYIELLKKVDGMTFATEDDKKRFTLIIKRTIKKLSGFTK